MIKACRQSAFVTGGYVGVMYSLKKPADPGNPATGETAMAAPMVLLLTLSAMGLAVVARKRRAR